MPVWVGAPLSKVGIEDEKPLRGSCGVGVGACAGKAHQTCHFRRTSSWEWSVGRGSSLSLDVDVVLLAGEWNWSQRITELAQTTTLFAHLCLGQAAPSILSTFPSLYSDAISSSKSALNHTFPTLPTPGWALYSPLSLLWLPGIENEWLSFCITH